MLATLLAIALASGTGFSSSHLARNGGYPGGASSDPSVATQAALTLYVDTAGSDSNACTASGSSACLTTAAACAKIPKRIRHPVVVNIGAGTFTTGCMLEGLSFESATAATGTYLKFVGTMSAFSPATGTATGTATGGATTSLTDSGQTWTVNDLQNKVIVLTGGTGAGQERIVRSNSATVIQVSEWGTTPNNTTTYAIKTWGTSFTGTGLTLPPNPLSADYVAGGTVGALTNYSTFIVGNIQAGAMTIGTGGSSTESNGGVTQGAPLLLFEHLKFDGVTRALSVRHSNHVGVLGCNCNNPGSSPCFEAIESDQVSIAVTAGTSIGNDKYLIGAVNRFGPAVSLVGRDIENTGGGFFGGDNSTKFNFAATGSVAFSDCAQHSGQATQGIVQLYGATSTCSRLSSFIIDSNGLGEGIVLGNFESGTSNATTGGRILITNGQRQSDISSVTGAAVDLAGPLLVVCGGTSPTLTGSSNSTFGWRLRNGARLLGLTAGNQQCGTVTGTSGDITLDGTTNVSYSEIVTNNVGAGCRADTGTCVNAGAN